MEGGCDDQAASNNKGFLHWPAFGRNSLDRCNGPSDLSRVMWRFVCGMRRLRIYRGPARHMAGVQEVGVGCQDQKPVRHPILRSRYTIAAGSFREKKLK
jgi:hypothetical protein